MTDATNSSSDTTTSSTLATPNSGTPQGALSGIRVVELATILMGPYGARILGDYGADVIRIESLTGDSSRNGAPFRNPGMSGHNFNVQRNKRSVSLNLKDPDGRDAALAIIATADVVVTNMRRAALERLGLDPTEMCERDPNLIVCVGNGYGSDGTYEGKAAYDDAIQAGSGLAWIVGQGRENQEPAYVPAIMADKVCGMTIAQAVLAAIVHRERTGEGQEIEVPMLETMVAFNLVEHQRGHAFEPSMGDFGYPRLFSPNRRPYRSADGWVAILPYDNRHWREFLTLIGRPELIDDPRFADHNSRVESIDEVYGTISDAAPSKTTAEWLKLCEERSIPCSPVLDPSKALDDPHLAAVGMIEVVEHPTEGPYKYVHDGPTLKRTPTGLHRHAPQLGEHTRAVLAEAGYAEDAIEKLVASGVARSA